MPLKFGRDSCTSVTSNISNIASRTNTILLVVAVAMSACDAPLSPTRVDSAVEPRFAVSSNPRAVFTYYKQLSQTRAIDNSSSGFITGDGREGGGVAIADSSVYDDGRCGVSAQVFWGASGDATMDPISLRMTNCNNSVRRYVTLSYGTPIVGASAPTITAGHFTNVREVQQLPFNGPSGNLAYRRFRLQPRGTTPCDYVRYGTIEGTSHTDFTTTIDGVAVTSKPIVLEAVAENVWIASSQPDADGKHVAICEVEGRKGVSYIAAYDIPFRVKVTLK